MGFRAALATWKDRTALGKIGDILKDIIDSLTTPHAFTDVVKPKVYRAHLTQSGSNIPTAVIFENSLGGTPAFVRSSSGIYTMTLTDAWVSPKTFIFIGQYGTNAVAGGGAAHRIQAVRTNANVITITTGNDTGNAVADGVLGTTPIEIFVYQ